VIGPILIGVVRVEATEPATLITPPAREQGGPRGTGVPFAQNYRVGELNIAGAKVVSSDVVRSMVGLTSGDLYDESRLRDGFLELMKLYGSLGHVNFVPVPDFRIDEQQRVVNLTINIDEGDRFVVSRIGFTGNTTVRDDVMRREVLLKEGAVFNASLLDATLLRLNRLGLFEDIKPEDALVQPALNEPKVEVTIRVREKAR
jgi:outer membrane protein insertion porin family